MCHYWDFVPRLTNKEMDQRDMIDSLAEITSLDELGIPPANVADARFYDTRVPPKLIKALEPRRPERRRVHPPITWATPLLQDLDPEGSDHPDHPDNPDHPGGCDNLAFKLSTHVPWGCSSTALQRREDCFDGFMRCLYTDWLSPSKPELVGVNGPEDGTSTFVNQIRDIYWSLPKSCSSCVGASLLARAHVVSRLMTPRLRRCQSPVCLSRYKTLDGIAPACAWNPFREMVLTLLSCWMPGLLLALAPPHVAERHMSDSGLSPSWYCFDVQGVLNTWRWATRVAFGNLGRYLWDQDSVYLTFNMVPSNLYHSQAVEHVEQCQNRGICPNRIWNVSMLGTGAIADIAPVASIALGITIPAANIQRHMDCTDEMCLYSNDNSTLIQQKHRCGHGKCGAEVKFPPQLLDACFHKAREASQQDSTNMQLDHWVSTAWHLPDTFPVPADYAFEVCGPGDDYMAISHVWSDGTGAGMKPSGWVNPCLLEFFVRTARDVGCGGIWWDAISIPGESQARKIAINQMLRNYEDAKVTVVHDQELVDFEWRDDGSPAIALILSAWFTRGWTAAELFASRHHVVKVLFKNPDDPEGLPLIKDLDRDILAWDPCEMASMRGCSREDLRNLNQRRYQYLLNSSGTAPRYGHYIATDILRRLRGESGGQIAETLAVPVVESLQDMLRVLRPRTTSWAKDQLIIPGLMCLPPTKMDSGATGPHLTQQLLHHFGSLPISYLIHGHIPLSKAGPWSWCPPSVFDLGQSASAHDRTLSRPCHITSDGRVLGEFEAFTLLESDSVVPMGAHPAMLSRITKALQDRRRCLILANRSQKYQEFVLAAPVSIRWHEDTNRLVMSCRWIGGVHLTVSDDLYDSWVMGQKETEMPTRNREGELPLRSTILKPILVEFGNDCYGLRQPIAAISAKATLDALGMDNLFTSHRKWQAGQGFRCVLNLSTLWGGNHFKPDKFSLEVCGCLLVVLPAPDACIC